MAPLYAPLGLNAPLFNKFSKFQVSYAKPNRVIGFFDGAGGGGKFKLPNRQP